MKTTLRTEYQREWRRKKRQDPAFRLKAAAIQRKFYAAIPDSKERHFVYRLKNRYGISKEQYDELFERQKGCCALCQRHQSILKTRLAIDHCHKTLEIRSLLCNYCNLRVVGKLRKDTIQPLYDYLNREYTGWVVPLRVKKKKKRKKKRIL